jgi:hypothetical protein
MKSAILTEETLAPVVTANTQAGGTATDLQSLDWV